MHKVLLVQHVLDCWKIWTGAWRVRAILEKQLENLGEVWHLPSIINIGPHRGYVTASSLWVA